MVVIVSSARVSHQRLLSNSFKEMKETRSERSKGKDKYRDEGTRREAAREKAAASFGGDGIG